MSFIKRSFLRSPELFVAACVVLCAVINAVWATVTVSTPDGSVVYSGDEIIVTAGGTGGPDQPVITNFCGQCTNCVYTTPENCEELKWFLKTRFQGIDDSAHMAMISITNAELQISSLIHDSTTMIQVANNETFGPSWSRPSTNRTQLMYGDAVNNFTSLGYDNKLQQDAYNNLLSNFNADAETNASVAAARDAIEYFVLNRGSFGGYGKSVSLIANHYINEFFYSVFVVTPPVVSNMVDRQFLQNNFDITAHYTSGGLPVRTNYPAVLELQKDHLRQIRTDVSTAQWKLDTLLDCSACTNNPPCETESCTNNPTGGDGCPTCEQIAVITQSLDIIQKDLENIQHPQTNILPAIYGILTNFFNTRPIDIDIKSEDWESIYSGLAEPMSSSWVYSTTNPLQRIELLLWSLTSLNSSNNVATESEYDANMSRILNHTTNATGQSSLLIDRIQEKQTNTLDMVLKYINPFKDLFENRGKTEVAYILPSVDLSFNGKQHKIEAIQPNDTVQPAFRIFHYACLSLYYLVAFLAVYFFWVQVSSSLYKIVKMIIELIQQFLQQ